MKLFPGDLAIFVYVEFGEFFYSVRNKHSSTRTHNSHTQIPGVDFPAATMANGLKNYIADP